MSILQYIARMSLVVPAQVQLVQDYPEFIERERTLYVTVNANLKVPANHVAKRLFSEG